jgi:CRP-like cAMP-binding protein
MLDPRMSDPLGSRFGREFPAGTVLFREGERGEVMFVVQSGAVRITKHVEGGEKVLAVLGAGEFFGEMAILNGKPRTATATVVEGARCLVIDPPTLQEMVARNTEIALRLIKKLAKRLDSADTLVEILLHRDPKARVLLALSRHAEAFGEELEGGGYLVRTDAASLASEVHVEAELAEDMLRRVDRLGIARRVPGGVVVAELGRLRDFVEFLDAPRTSMAPGRHESTPPRSLSDAARSAGESARPGDGEAGLAPDPLER